MGFKLSSTLQHLQAFLTKDKLQKQCYCRVQSTRKKWQKTQKLLLWKIIYIIKLLRMYQQISFTLKRETQRGKEELGERKVKEIFWQRKKERGEEERQWRPRPRMSFDCLPALCQCWSTSIWRGCVLGSDHSLNP